MAKEKMVVSVDCTYKQSVCWETEQSSHAVLFHLVLLKEEKKSKPQRVSSAFLLLAEL